MNEENNSSSENLKNSEDLQQRLERAEAMVTLQQEEMSYQQETFFRMSLIRNLQHLTQTLEEKLDLISKKVNNITKVIAAKEGIELEQ